MTTTNKYLLGGALLVVAIVLFIIYRKKKDAEIDGVEKLCFDLPTSPDTEVFGPSYWNAFHTLAGRIPCGGCRGFAERFMVYFHDLVNVKLGKPIHDQANYLYFNSSISKLSDGQDIKTAFAIPQI